MKILNYISLLLDPGILCYLKPVILQSDCTHWLLLFNMDGPLLQPLTQYFFHCTSSMVPGLSWNQSSIPSPSCYCQCLPSHFLHLPPQVTPHLWGHTSWLESESSHPGITALLSASLGSLPIPVIYYCLSWQEMGLISISHSLPSYEPPGTVRFGETCVAQPCSGVRSWGLGSLTTFPFGSVFPGQAFSQLLAISA